MLVVPSSCDAPQSRERPSKQEYAKEQVPASLPDVFYHRDVTSTPTCTQGREETTPLCVPPFRL